MMTGAILRAYKTGWQKGFRHARYVESIRPGCTELARQVMMNEFERTVSKRRAKKARKGKLA